MNRNTEAHFADNPTNLDIQRSKFKRPFQHKTTFNTGDLVPVYIDEVLPGDTVTMDMSSITRMSTPIFPVMDNAYMDTYFFFVPNRLVWEHWKEFNGENTTTYWEQIIDFEVPQIKSPSGGWTKGTLADYMGIPTKVDNLSVQSLPFRAYCEIWNEWFRSENLKQPCLVNKDDALIIGSNGEDYITDAQRGGKPCKVAKYHDYFTAALPQPQKGPEVALPMGTTADVYAKGQPLLFGTTDETTFAYLYAKAATPGNAADAQYYTTGGEFVAGDNGLNLYGKQPLYVDLTTATGTTINSLRQAFAIQRLYEKDARGGTRYIEMIRAHFGVVSPDARQQRPEYLGGFRQQINVDQVIQTSGTTEVTPQGNTAAYSMTTQSDHMFTKSFTEHGYLIGLVCIRTEHTYQQGIERFWSRKSRFDYYWPTFANLSEQAILNKEIYATGTAADEEVFGYQEAWAEYRYKPNRVSSSFRSNYETTLDSWHYADNYASQPILSSGWIDETKANVNRTIAVSEEIEDQFIADFYFDSTWVRPMPVYSIPGLIDHH